MAWQYKQGQGIWEEWVNSETGESSIHTITPKLIKTYCNPEDHYFVLVSPSSRDLECRYCGLGARLFLGHQKLVDGKIKKVY